MKFKKVRDLMKFINEIDVELLKDGNKHKFEYPYEMVKDWNAEAIKEENETLLKRISGEANIYAIFTTFKNSSEYSLRYIGKTKRKNARERIKHHLIKKNEKTGAKLDNIKKCVNEGGAVKISWMKIEPESLRNCIEEELIIRHPEADWNKEYKKCKTDL